MKAVIITQKADRFSVRFTDNMGPRLKRLETHGTKVVFAEPMFDIDDKLLMLGHAIKVATNNNQLDFVALLKTRLVKETLKFQKQHRKNLLSLNKV